MICLSTRGTFRRHFEDNLLTSSKYRKTTTYAFLKKLQKSQKKLFFYKFLNVHEFSCLFLVAAWNQCFIKLVWLLSSVLFTETKFGFIHSPQLVIFIQKILIVFFIKISSYLWKFLHSLCKNFKFDFYIEKFFMFFTEILQNFKLKLIQSHC